MVWTWIITFIALIVIFIILFKLIKKVFLTIIIFTIIILVVLAGLGLWIYSDVTDIMEHAPNSNNALYIQDEGLILTGAQIPPEGDLVLLTDEEIATASTNINNENMDYFSQNNYFTIFVDLNTIDPLFAESLEMGKISIKKETYMTALKTTTPFKTLLSSLNQEENENYIQRNIPIDLKPDSPSTSQERLAIIGLATKDNVENPEIILPLIIKGYQEDKIIIHPNKFTFRLIKSLPLSLIESMVSDSVK